MVRLQLHNMHDGDRNIDFKIEITFNYPILKNIEKILTPCFQIYKCCFPVHCRVRYVRTVIQDYMITVPNVSSGIRQRESALNAEILGQVSSIIHFVDC